MSITEIVASIGGSGIFIVLLSLIKVKPLEISVWHWLARKLGRAFNGDTLERVDSIQKSLNEHLQAHEKTNAETNRQRILRFADELYNGKRHSKDAFDDIMDIMRDYDSYCEKHEDFKNGRTQAAAEIINSTYKQVFQKHDFAEEKND